MNSRRVSRLAARTLVVLALALAAVFVTGPVRAHDPAVVDDADLVVLSSYTWYAPDIDGRVHLGAGETEWRDAKFHDFGSWRLYVKNDTNNLYLAVVYEGTVSGPVPPDSSARVTLTFDNDHDGDTPDAGDDCIVGIASPLDVQGVFEDRHFNGMSWVRDSTLNGSAAWSAGGITGVPWAGMEFSHPLDSADDGEDFSLDILDRIGFHLRIDLNSGGGTPSNIFEFPQPGVNQQDYYGDIVIGPSTPPDVRIYDPNDIGGAEPVQDGGTLIADEGRPLRFVVFGLDEDNYDVVSISSTLPTGGSAATTARLTSLSGSGPANPAQLLVEWTPISSDVGVNHTFQFTATDSADLVTPFSFNVFVNAHTGLPSLVAYTDTPPTVDGQIWASEWQHAAYQQFGYNNGGSGQIGYIRVMNDDTNLYVGIEFYSPPFGATGTLLRIYFDNENDDALTSGEDLIEYTFSNASPAGLYRDHYLSIPGTIPGYSDDGPLDQDGAGYYNDETSVLMFEFVKPLDSATDLYDFSRSVLETLGFQIEVDFTFPTYNQVSHAPATNPTDVGNYGTIEIATGAPLPFASLLGPGGGPINDGDQITMALGETERFQVGGLDNHDPQGIDLVDYSIEAGSHLPVQTILPNVWNVTYAPTEAGTHTLSFTFQDVEFGYSDTITFYVEVLNPPPTLSFWLYAPPGDPLAEAFDPDEQNTIDWARWKTLKLWVRAADSAAESPELTVSHSTAGTLNPDPSTLTGNEIDTVFIWRPVEADVLTNGGLHQITFTVTDGVNPAVEKSIWIQLEADRDGDGLPDRWEMPAPEGGFEWDNGDGTFTPVYLANLFKDHGGDKYQSFPADGVDPDRKDVIVYVDYLVDYVGVFDPTPGAENPVWHSHKPHQAAMEWIAKAFATAPVDEVTPGAEVYQGVNLHILVGTGVEETDDLKLMGEFSPAPDGAGRIYRWEEFQAIKDQHFPTELSSAVHYALMAHQIHDTLYSKKYTGMSRNGDQDDGDADLEGASDFIVSLGGIWDSLNQQNPPPVPPWTEHDIPNGPQEYEAGVFMHELGHNLGLLHGANVPKMNYMPNYLSVMNYLFLAGLVIDDDGEKISDLAATDFDAYKDQAWKLFSYSRFVLGDLIEDYEPNPPVDPSGEYVFPAWQGLNENEGILGGITDQKLQDVLAHYGTRWFYPGSTLHEVVVLRPINWNDDYMDPAPPFPPAPILATNLACDIDRSDRPDLGDPRWQVWPDLDDPAGPYGTYEAIVPKHYRTPLTAWTTQSGEGAATVYHCDWDSLDFAGGNIGASTLVPQPEYTIADEMELDELVQIFPPPPPGSAPTAYADTDAGTALIYTSDPDGAEVTLDGGGSQDPDVGDGLWYFWSEDGDPLGEGETLTCDFAVGSHIVTLVVEDRYHRSAPSTVEFHVILNHPPVCRAGGPYQADDQGIVGTAVTLDGTGSSDPDDDGLLFTWTASDPDVVFNDPHSETPTGTFFSGVTSVTLTVTDGIYTRVDSTTVTVSDLSAPVFSDAPLPDYQADCMCPVGAELDVPAPAVWDEIDPDPVVSCGVTLPRVFPIGETTITWTATDAAGNSMTADQVVRVIDPNGPEFDDAPLPDWVEEAGGPDGNSTTVTAPDVTDLCDENPVVACSVTFPHLFPLGDTVITWTATDSDGNANLAIQTVRILDRTAPVFPGAPLEDYETDCMCALGAEIDLAVPAAEDTVDVDVLVTCSVTLPQVFPIGETTVTWTATDDSGNTATTDQLVRVVDPEGPVFDDAPLSDWVLEATGPGGREITLPTPAVSDLCDEHPEVTCSVTFPCLFPVGVSVITWTATDDEGNTTTADQTVRIVDTTAPVISGFTLSPDTLWSPNHSMEVIGLSIEVSDAVDQEVECSIIGVTSDEVVLGPEGTTPDWFFAGLDLQLRAERDGRGDGRVYTITIQCTDDAGNATTAAATVLVPHSKSSMKPPKAPGENEEGSSGPEGPDGPPDDAPPADDGAAAVEGDDAPAAVPDAEVETPKEAGLQSGGAAAEPGGETPPEPAGSTKENPAAGADAPKSPQGTVPAGAGATEGGTKPAGAQKPEGPADPLNKDGLGKKTK